LHAANAAPSRLHWNVAGSEAENWKVAEEDVVVAGGPEVIVVSGGVVSGGLVSVTVNEDELVPVPFGLVTEIGPELAPLGTVARIEKSELTVNVAAFPANVTEVAPVRLSPAIPTSVPGPPLEGENASIHGAVEPQAPWNTTALTVRAVGVVTEIGPAVAAAGTLARISASETTVKLASNSIPLN
jgi:hypothetical protein